MVFYFSGHGVQIGGMNYLLPVDVRAQVEDQVRDDSIALGDLLGDLARQKPALTLAIVDACRNNPFPTKGRAINDVVHRVRAEVHRLAQSSNHEQVPAIYDQVLGRFYFYAPNSNIVVNMPAAPATTIAPSVDMTALELAFWNSIKDSRDPHEFAAYLEQYPGGQFAT